jgi:thiamine kinase-like enzyme
MPRPLADEFAALALVPVDVGPQPVALDPAPDNPLGHPWLAATWVPGNSKPPAAWTEADLQVWAQVLARLHDPVYQRRGPVRQPTIEGLSLVSEFEQILAWWRDNQPAVATTPAAAALGERVLNWLGDYEADFRRLDRFSFIHADLVAGNVVFDGPRCWLVDWEWAEIGDVARDLALLGGWGAAGPSYVPLNDAQINLLLETYANAVLVKSGSRPDLESLRRRRDAWEMCNRYPTCLHYQLQARRSDPTGVYAEAAAQLWDSIATRLATA